MAAVPQLLSESTNGRAIPIVQTSGPSGDKIHESTSTAGEMDLITLYAWNMSTGDETLVIEWGGTGSANELIRVVSAQSGYLSEPTLVIPNLPLNGGLEVRAFNSGGTASITLVAGKVVRYS